MNQKPSLRNQLVVEGTTRWMRGERDQCICCDGPHVFARYVEVGDEVPDRARARRIDSTDRSDHLDVIGWLSEVLYTLPEGSRIRITAEQVDAT